jgi:hypothetical protein
MLIENGWRAENRGEGGLTVEEEALDDAGGWWIGRF